MAVVSASAAAASAAAASSSAVLSAENAKITSNYHGKCPLPKDVVQLYIPAKPIVGPLTFQHLMLLISTAAAGVTLVISLFLILKHLHRFTLRKQQRQIIRIIFTPVVFSVLSALSILNYQVAIYMTPLIELYETFALVAIFLLYVEYSTPDSNTREAFFEGLDNRKPKKWTLKPSQNYTIVPGGSLRWYHSKVVAVFTFAMIQIAMTIVQEVTQALGDYCETSFNPRFAHIWVVVIENVTLGWAIDAVVRFYIRMKGDADFASHKPGLKIISFKLIVFVNATQSLIFDILLVSGAVKGSSRITLLDLKYGLPAALVAIEQIFFAIFFHYSFRSREYHESNKGLEGTRMGTFRAAAHAFNPWDILVGMGTAIKLISSGIGPRGNGAWRREKKGRGRSGDYAVSAEPMSSTGGRAWPTAMNTSYEYAGLADQENESTYTGYDGGNTTGDYLLPHAAQPGRPRSTSETGLTPPPGYDVVDDERANLNPRFAGTHSRDSSVGGEARSTREMV